MRLLKKLLMKRPELSSLTWLDAKRRVMIGVTSANATTLVDLYPGVVVNDPDVVNVFQLSQRAKATPLLQAHHL